MLFRATAFEWLFLKQFFISNKWLNLNWNIGLNCNRFCYIATCYLVTCVISIVSFAVIIWDISLKRGWTFGQTFSPLIINRLRDINDASTKMVLNNFSIPLSNKLFWFILPSADMRLRYSLTLTTFNEHWTNRSVHSFTTANLF